MPDRLLKYQLAAAVLAIWEQDVHRFAPDEHLRWQTLLKRLPEDIAPGQLCAALTPLVAKNEKEQALFAAIFERAEWEVAEKNKEDEPLLPPPPPSFFEENWYLIAGILLAIFMVYQWFFRILPDTSPRFDRLKIYIDTAPETQKNACPDSISLTRLGIVREAIFLNDRDTLTTQLGRYTLLPGGCVSFAAGEINGVDSVRFTIRYKEEGMAGDGPRSSFHYAIPVDIFVSISDPVVIDSLEEIGTSYKLESHPPPFNHDQLLRNLEFSSNDTLVRWAPWIKIFILLALAGLLYEYLKWRAQRRKKLIAQRDKSAKPPYVWNIRIKNLAPPDPGEAFGHTINALRRRADDASRLIDLPETVRATIRGAGMAEFRLKQQTRPPEYLMLVDRRNAHDHQARLYDDLYRILLQNEVLAERFFFDGDIKICINEQHPEGLSIDELLFRFPGHRLLIIGSARQFFSTNTGGLAPWTKAFSKWKERALLSTLPAGEWGRRERALAELFRFAPASLSGLGSLIEAFEADTEQRAPQLDRLASLSTAVPVLLEGGDLLQTLEKHFPDPSTRTWLATCALWPELHYDLTLWLGQWLGQESGQPVATMQRFSDLLRLPWFANGEMPDYARAVLLDWLRQSSPSLESRIRTALHLMLEENAPPEDSAAWDDFDMRIAFNEWQITTDPKTKKALEEKIALWLEQNEPDFIVVRELIG